MDPEIAAVLSHITFVPAPASRIMWSCAKCGNVGLHRRMGRARIRLSDVIESVLTHDCKGD